MKAISRSLLFVPGDRPERFAKAAAAGAHQVVIDLEDAVALGDKDEARVATREWLTVNRNTVVRINGTDTPWFAEDIRMVSAVPGTLVMLPKVDANAVAKTAELLPGHEIIALIETIKGYFELSQVASEPGVIRLAFGSVDFASESGISDEDQAMTPVRIQIVMESVRAGLSPPIDGVSIGFSDPEQMRRDAECSRRLGFGGKLCIHPKQVAEVNAAFQPSAAQLDWARRVMSATAASQGGVTTVDGKMVDKPIVDQAQRILASEKSYS